jgi:hypothetical protein
MGDVAQVMVDQVKIILAAPAATAGAAPAAAAAAAAAATAPLGSSGVASAVLSWLASSKAWLLSCLADGQSLMVVMTVLVVLPLSCQKHMRSLETAAAVGMLVVVALLGVLAVGALSAGLPAVMDGELPLWSLKVGRSASGLSCQHTQLQLGLARCFGGGGGSRHSSSSSCSCATCPHHTPSCLYVPGWLPI